jgi:hypothetical protein
MRQAAVANPNLQAEGIAVWFLRKPPTRSPRPSVQRSLGYGGCLGSEKTYCLLVHPVAARCSGSPISADQSPDRLLHSESGLELLPEEEDSVGELDRQSMQCQGVGRGRDRRSAPKGG